MPYTYATLKKSTQLLWILRPSSAGFFMPSKYFACDSVGHEAMTVSK